MCKTGRPAVFATVSVLFCSQTHQFACENTPYRFSEAVEQTAGLNGARVALSKTSRLLTTNISSCDAFTTAWTQRPLEWDLMIVSLCQSKRIAWMLPPVLCVCESRGWSSWYYVDSSPERLIWGDFTPLKNTPSQQGPSVHSSPLSALYGRGIPPQASRRLSRYKKDCWILFWEFPYFFCNHSRYEKKSSFTWSSSSIPTHAIFNTFSPHFRTHLPHCLIRRSHANHSLFPVKQWTSCKKLYTKFRGINGFSLAYKWN